MLGWGQPWDEAGHAVSWGRGEAAPGEGEDYDQQQSTLPIASLCDCEGTSAHDPRSERESGALAPHSVEPGMGNLWTKFTVWIRGKSPGSLARSSGQ